MPPSKPAIAIAGATGGLGKELTKTFLSAELRDTFSHVILLSRQSTPQLDAWAAQGAKVVLYDEDDLAKCLEGVDVLVNAIAFRGAGFRDKLLHALPASSVQLYLPSEFGVDHTFHDFAHPEWDAKKRHYALAQQILPERIKMCRLFISLFLDDGVGPWYGFDTKAGVYETAGSADSQVSYTAIEDVARVISVICEMKQEEIPTELRIAGTTASMKEIAEIMGRAGAGKVQIVELDGKEFKAASLKESEDPVRYLRFLMGDGSIDHRPKGMGGRGNDNEAVNPGQERWRWKTLEDVAREANGRPHAD